MNYEIYNIDIQINNSKYLVAFCKNPILTDGFITMIRIIVFGSFQEFFALKQGGKTSENRFTQVFGVTVERYNGVTV